MCGAYGFTIKEVGEAYRRFHIVNSLPHFASRYNARPSQDNPVVVHTSPNKIVRMEWGIERGWSTRPIINATAEKLSTSKLWLPLLRLQRCLVIASFFYEPDKSVSPSQPYLFRLKSGELFALAGLYEDETDPRTKQVIPHYVIITRNRIAWLKPYILAWRPY
jgi:putative SOS response-associated peptidase YedK